MKWYLLSFSSFFPAANFHTTNHLRHELYYQPPQFHSRHTRQAGNRFLRALTLVMTDFGRNLCSCGRPRLDSLLNSPVWTPCARLAGSSPGWSRWWSTGTPRGYRSSPVAWEDNSRRTLSRTVPSAVSVLYSLWNVWNHEREGKTRLWDL